MALVNTGIDSWILEYEACEKLSREIMEQLHARDKELPGSMPYDSLSGRVRLRLRQYSNEVTQLRTKLKTPDSSMTDGEKERRVRQVDELQSRLVQLEKQFNGSNGSRRGPAVRAATSGWADDDDDDDEDKFSIQREIRNNAPISDLRAEQAQLLRDQEAGLEQLSTVIARQKRIATVINQEVDDQNALLDEITTNVDIIDTRVRGETSQISTIIRKDTTCWYWMVILLLMIAIVGVLLAPGR